MEEYTTKMAGSGGFERRDGSRSSKACNRRMTMLVRLAFIMLYTVGAYNRTLFSSSA